MLNRSTSADGRFIYPSFPEVRLSGNPSTRGPRSRWVRTRSVDYARQVKDLSSLDESRLVAAANRGHSGAFVEIHRRHAGWVASLARRWTSSEEDALDVVQEVFTDLWRRFPGFHLHSTLRAYLYPAIRNRCIDCHRRRRREAPLESAEEPSVLPARHRFEDSAELRDILKSLPETHHEVVVLRFAYDFRLAEISAALNVPVGTVKSRLHNALRLLRAVGERKRKLD